MSERLLIAYGPGFFLESLIIELSSVWDFVVDVESCHGYQNLTRMMPRRSSTQKERAPPRFSLA